MKLLIVFMMTASALAQSQKWSETQAANVIKAFLAGMDFTSYPESNACFDTMFSTVDLLGSDLS